MRLRYLYIGTKSKVRGHPKEFDGTIDLSHLLPLVTETYDWDGTDVPIHYALVYAVMLKRKLKVVIVDFLSSDKKTQSRKFIFSTDCSMWSTDVIALYRSRFQIEFLFRAAQQYTLLTACQARNAAAISFAFTLSLSVINVSKFFGTHPNLHLSISACKLLLHNALLIERFLSMFGNAPTIDKNQGQKEHYFKELMLFGLKATPQ